MFNSIIFVLAPIIGFLGAGTLKFIINSIKLKRLAFSEVGLGNFPSTHNCVASTTYFVIGFSEGFNSPISSLSLALCLLVAIDSLDLRKKIESHAKLLKELSDKNKKIKMKLGHNIFEVAGGYVLGFLLALILINF